MSELSLIDVTETVTIDQSPHRVFLRMVEQFDSWWGEPMRSPQCQAAQFQRRVGGLVWEDHGSSTGVLLGTVSRLEGESLIVVDGSFGLADALSGTVSLSVSAENDATTVTIHQRSLGTFADETAGQRRDGWVSLLARLARAGNPDGSPNGGDTGLRR